MGLQRSLHMNLACPATYLTFFHAMNFATATLVTQPVNPIQPN